MRIPHSSPHKWNRFNFQRFAAILMTEHSFNFSRFSTLTFLLCWLLVCNCQSALCLDELYGPEKPKTVKTPFGEGDSKKGDEPSDSLGTIEIGNNHETGRRGLGERLGSLQSKLYLPDKMVLGRVAEFTIKGKPGKWVAIAMADKDSGSKPILGHNLRLGPDRKVMVTARLPASGVANLLVECPVEGDLVGSYLYFEAAVWSEDNMQDMELAQCVVSESKKPNFNGVLIQPQFEQKKGVRIIPTTTSPFMGQQQQQGLSSPHP